MRVRCPDCRHPFTLRPREQTAKRVVCPECDAEFPPPRAGGGSLVPVFVILGLGLIVLVGSLGVAGVAWFLFAAGPAGGGGAAGVGGPDFGPMAGPNGVVNPAPNLTPPTPFRTFPTAGGPQLKGDVQPPPPPAVRPPADPPKPPPPFQFPPVPEPLPITPSPVTAATTYALPEVAARVCVAGGGRYLLFLFPKLQKVGVFDVSEAKIVRYITLPEENPQLAAGMHKLAVYLPTAKLLQRYDLASGELEKSVPAGQAVEDGAVEAFCLGHASAGPLLVAVAGKNARLLDLDTLAAVSPPAHKNSPRSDGRLWLPSGVYWAGATGRVFGHSVNNDGILSGVKSFVYEDGTYTLYGEHQSSWFVVPGPDDRHVFAGGNGVVSERIKKLDGVPHSMGTSSAQASHIYLPAAHGPYHFHAQMIDGNLGSASTVPKGHLRVFLHGSADPLLTRPDARLPDYGDWNAYKGVGLNNALHLIPAARLFVVVAPTLDRLHLSRVDLDAALDQSGRDYLLVSSFPPARYKPGAAFRYKPEVKARHRPVAVKLESGPPGMTATADGTVTWTPPAGATDKQAVVLLVKDKSGRELFHTFELTAEK